MEITEIPGQLILFAVALDDLQHRLDSLMVGVMIRPICLGSAKGLIMIAQLICALFFVLLPCLPTLTVHPVSASWCVRKALRVVVLAVLEGLYGVINLISLGLILKLVQDYYQIPKEKFDVFMKF